MQVGRKQRKVGPWGSEQEPSEAFLGLHFSDRGFLRVQKLADHTGVSEAQVRHICPGVSAEACGSGLSESRCYWPQ